MNKTNTQQLNRIQRVLTGPGQVNVGDKVSFTRGGSSTVILVTAEKILYEGSSEEEVVYNIRENHFFITAMIMKGTSSFKNVTVTPCALTLALEQGWLRAVQPESLTHRFPHELFIDSDPDKPEQICDRNGQVALSQCKNCGLAESELTDVLWCKPKRTLLEEFDLDQSPEYHKGREDGRVKGYEVGYRHATERLTERLAQAAYPSALKNLLQQTLDALENSSDIVFMDLKKASLRDESIAALQAAITQSEQPTHNLYEASRDAAVVTLPPPAEGDAEDAAPVTVLGGEALSAVTGQCFDMGGPTACVDVSASRCTVCPNRAAIPSQKESK